MTNESDGRTNMTNAELVLLMCLCLVATVYLCAGLAGAVGDLPDRPTSACENGNARQKPSAAFIHQTRRLNQVIA